MDRAPRWQPLLHAATRRDGPAWRVRPPRATDGGLCAIVEEVLADANPLTSPVHLLVRHGPHTVVGGFTRSATLTDELRSASDRCFVGWVTAAPTPGVPRLERLEDRWVAWAGEVYDSWIAIDWDRAPSGREHEPPLGPAPWSADDELPHVAPVGPVAGAAVPPARDLVRVGGHDRFERWSTAASCAGDLALLAGDAGGDPAGVLHLTASEGPASTAEPIEPYVDGDWIDAGFTGVTHRRR